MAQREKNYRPPYDGYYLTQFKVLYPDKVEVIREDMRKKFPYATPKTIEKHVDHEILPIILEEPTKNFGGGGDAVHFGAFWDGEGGIENSSKIPTWEASSVNHLVELTMEFVEILPPIDKQLVQMAFGLHPYERAFMQAEISEALKVSQQAVSKKMKTIMRLLKKAHEATVHEE